jgi:prepilin-type N-terminal cleavage/methylation domain-containing protein
MKSETLKILKNKKGFSLLEMLVAVFIFSLVIVVVISVFVNVVNVRKKTKEIQQNMENARVAMGTIAKEVRNNPMISQSASFVRMYDDAQKLCLEYAFASSNLYYRYLTVVDQSGCTAATSLTGSVPMLSGNVSGKFEIVPSVADVSVGRATILMEVQNSASTDKIKLQASASLRSLSQEINPN